MSAPSVESDPGRRAHYADFYDPAAPWLRPRHGGELPTLAVVGNCQAEAVRLLVDGDDLTTVRIPPVHEWTGADLPSVERMLARVDVLLTQPITDDYRGLPVGAAQLTERLRPDARAVMVPAIRYAGFHPCHLVVHPPGLAQPDPPLAAYHDVRTAVRAAWARAGLTPIPPEAPGPTADAVRRIAAASLAELRRREQAAGAVPVSDLLERPDAVSMRTVNHPGNAVLAPLAARVRAVLGLAAQPPGISRPVLDAVHAPVGPVVLAALGLAGTPTDDWRIDGRSVPAAEVEETQLRWYATRPDVLDAVLDRTVELRCELDLTLPGEERS